MLAVVKKHHTKKTLFEVKGKIPHDVVNYLKKKFGTDIEILDEGEESINILESQWFKKISSEITPGEALKNYRENLGITQDELGQKLGKFTRQKISDIENGKRSISKDVAKKLSSIFKVPVERFI